MHEIMPDWILCKRNEINNIFLGVLTHQHNDITNLKMISTLLFHIWYADPDRKYDGFHFLFELYLHKNYQKYME